MSSIVCLGVNFDIKVMQTPHSLGGLFYICKISDTEKAIYIELFIHRVHWSSAMAAVGAQIQIQSCKWWIKLLVHRWWWNGARDVRIESTKRFQILAADRRLHFVQITIKIIKTIPSLGPQRAIMVSEVVWFAITDEVDSARFLFVTLSQN